MPQRPARARIGSMVDTAAFRASHAAIELGCDDLAAVARRLPALSPAGRERERAAVVARLDQLEGHMLLDERLLFREVSTRLGDPLATASMSYDHLAIRDWTRRIRAAAVDAPEDLQELLYGLAALLRVHLWKENELYLAMLDSASWPAGV
jgi:hypothetical protein